MKTEKAKRTMFRDNNYAWVHRDGSVALLRNEFGEVERWRVAMPGDNMDECVWSTTTPYTFVEKLSLADELPRWGRADLVVGQLVEIHERFTINWKAGDGYGVIDSAYWAPGSRRYRVRLTTSGVLRSFKAHDVGLIG